MALINIDMVQKKVLSLLKGMEPPRGVDILSYKRNRGITLLLINKNYIGVRERGYCDQDLKVDKENLPKLLKSMIKREFPRSRKVRLYQLAGPEEIDTPRKKL